MFIALSNCVVPILFFLLQGAVGEPYYFPYDVSETSLGFLQSETEGFDTDLFRLSIQNSTVIPNAHGLFSKQDLSPNTTNEVVKIICEFRGYLIPMDSVLPGSVLPSVANEVTGDVYALEGNSVCHHVQDCVDLNSNPSGGTDSRNRTGFDLYPNCIYNTMLIYEFGKAFLVPLREIKAGDELFASFGA